MQTLVTLSDMLKERGSVEADADDDGKEQQEQDEDSEAEQEEEREEMPAQEVGEDVEAVLESLEGALVKSTGRLRLRQEELERLASDKVARAKRLAAAGSRNAEGELVQVPHRILTLTLVRSSKVDGTRQSCSLRVVLLGNTAEREDVTSEQTRFVEEGDLSLLAVRRYLERRYIKQTDGMAALGDSALSDLIRDSLAGDATLLLLTCLSSDPSHFLVSVADCRFASYKSRQRPSTAQRLERVKFRWQNQAVAWAWALWKGAVEDSVVVQLTHQVENLTEEVEELKKEKAAMHKRMEEVARKGIPYELEQARQDEDEDALHVSTT
eukprot:763337-Hanusia_phi.AAC.4